MTDIAKQIHEQLAKLQYARETNRIKHYVPYGWQEKFHNAVGFQTETPAVEKAAICANQIGKCVGISTKIQHPDGTESTAGDLYKSGKPFPVLSWNGAELVEARAAFAIKKPPETIYRVYLQSGDWFDCSARHRVLTSDGWHYVGHSLSYALCLPACASAFVLSVLRADAKRWFGRLLGFLACCLGGSRSCDEQPQSAEDSDLVFARQQDGALERTWISWRWGDPVYTNTSIGQQASAHHANSCVRHQIAGRCAESVAQVGVSTSLGSLWNSLKLRLLSSAAFCQLQSVFERAKSQDRVCALVSGGKEANKIVAYSVIGTQDLYDFWVPEFGNYYASGAIHHNTFCAASELAMHMTGIYPDWWKGMRFYMPTDWIVAGNTNEVTRDICQNELLGDPKDERRLGTGTIPKHLIGTTTRKPGVPNAYETVQVRHATGRWSSATFKCYEQGFKKFMGIRANGAWLDEEPPLEILSQVRRSCFARNPSLIMLTLTPEEGATQVVSQFLDSPQKGQAVIRATWDDAPHMTEEVKAQKLATIPEHEREMRTKGVPFAGAGMIFPFSEDRIVVDPFEVPRHWPLITGIDFGTDHPFAACMLAWDRDSDTVYLINEYKERRAIPAVHASAIKRWKGASWAPVAWPHDGLNTEKSTGDELRSYYVNEGLKMLPQRATNPPQAGQEEGQGGNSVEASILAMYERMELGQWKVFRTCREWLMEQRNYHRDVNGKIVKINDDLISASRTAHMMLRHARTETVIAKRRPAVAGISNW